MEVVVVAAVEEPLVVGVADRPERHLAACPDEPVEHAVVVVAEEVGVVRAVEVVVRVRRARLPRRWTSSCASMEGLTPPQQPRSTRATMPGCPSPLFALSCDGLSSGFTVATPQNT